MSTAVADPPHRNRNRSGRRLKRIIIVLVVVAGLLVGTDFAVAAFGEHLVSQEAREQLDLDQDPAVNVHGFPFTPQALSGDYDHLSVSAKGVPVEDILRDVSINAELYDVDAPLSDLRAGNVDNITIGELEGGITLKASDLAHVPPLTKTDDLSIAPASKSYVQRGEEAEDETEDEAENTGNGSDAGNAGSEDGDDQSDISDEDDSTAGIRLGGNTSIAGRELEIFAFAMVELDGTTIQIKPERIQFGDDQTTTVVPPEVQQQLLPNFEADINTGELPFTVTPKAVEVEHGSITLQGEAEDVTFSGSPRSATQE